MPPSAGRSRAKMRIHWASMRGSVRLHDTHDTVFACAASRENGLLPRRQVKSLKFKYPLQDWAAEQGHADLLDRLLLSPATVSLVVSIEAKRMAAERGHLAVVQWICRNSKTSRSNRNVIFADALANGQLGLATWLHHYYDRKPECTPYVRGSALAASHDDVVRWIDETFPDVKRISRAYRVEPGDWNDPIVSAVNRGQFEEVRRLVELGRGAFASDTIIAAACAGHLEIAQWLDTELQKSSQNVPPTVFADAVLPAALYGKLDVVRWLVNVKGAWHRDLLFSATMSTDVDMVAFVFNHSTARARLQGVRIEDVVDCNIDIMGLLAKGGAAVIHWLMTHAPGEMKPRELPALRVVNTFERYHSEEESTLRTQTEVLNRFRPYQWGPVSAQPRDRILRASRMVFLSLPAAVILSFEWLPQWAIRTNSHEVQRALVAMQQPRVFTISCLRLLLESTRNSKIVRWFLDDEAAESLLEAQKTRIVQWAARYARVDLLQWLLARYDDLPTLRTAVWAGAKYSHIVVLQCVSRCLRRHDTVFCRRVWRSATVLAAERGHLDVIKWLYDNEAYSFGESRPSLVGTAARYGHTPVLEWLYTSTEGKACCSMCGLQSAVGNRRETVVRWVVRHNPQLVAQASINVLREIVAVVGTLQNE